MDFKELILLRLSPRLLRPWSVICWDLKQFTKFHLKKSFTIQNQDQWTVNSSVFWYFHWEFSGHSLWFPSTFLHSTNFSSKNPLLCKNKMNGSQRTEHFEAFPKVFQTFIRNFFAAIHKSTNPSNKSRLPSKIQANGL